MADDKCPARGQSNERLCFAKDHTYSYGKDILANCSAGDASCTAPIAVVRPRVALANIYKPGSFVTAEEIQHARACQTPSLAPTYGRPVWNKLSHDGAQVYEGKRYKFIKDHLDLDNIMDFAWCELEEKGQRCKLHGGIVVNGGIVLSWKRCERKENKNGDGPVRVLDAPLAFVDPGNDAVCSCTYPRCFAGKLVSEYSIMSPEGEGLKLKFLLKIGGTHAKVDELFPALEAKLKGCCESKTRAYIDYAREKCGEKQLGEVCASTPNGFATPA